MGEMIFDKQDALRRLDGDEALLNIVVETFLDDIPCQIEALRDAIAADNAQEARRLTHSLKGASANIGATRLQNVAMEMEERMKAGALAEIGPSLTVFIQAFEEFKRYIQA